MTVLIDFLPLGHVAAESKHLVSVESSRKRLLQQVLVLGCGFAGTLLTLYLAHSMLKHADAPEVAPFRPLDTCSAPPLGCWDGWSKEHHPKCTIIKRDTYVRGELYSAGTEVCYKPVFFNVEPRTFAIISLFILWAIISERTLERLGRFLFEDNRKFARWHLVMAVLMDLPSVWYSCSVLIHYLNDSFFDFFYSQLYYSCTELLIFVAGVYLTDRRASPLPTFLSHFALGTTCFHLLQLVYDERFLFFGGQTPQTMLRNVMFFGTDSCFSMAFLQVLQSNHGRVDWKAVMIIVVVNLLCFRLVFADEASIGLSA